MSTGQTYRVTEHVDPARLLEVIEELRNEFPRVEITLTLGAEEGASNEQSARPRALPRQKGTPDVRPLRPSSEGRYGLESDLRERRRRHALPAMPDPRGERRSRNQRRRR
jgi:hypothetical protein